MIKSAQNLNKTSSQNVKNEAFTKREEFAVSLRKTKKAAILDKRR